MRSLYGSLGLSPSPLPSPMITPRLALGSNLAPIIVIVVFAVDIVSVVIFLLFLFMLFLLLLLVLFFYMFARMFQAVLPRKAPFRPSQCWTVVSPTRRASSPLREVFRLMTPFSHVKALAAPRFDHLSRAASPDDRAGLGT